MPRLASDPSEFMFTGYAHWVRRVHKVSLTERFILIYIMMFSHARGPQVTGWTMGGPGGGGGPASARSTGMVGCRVWTASAVLPPAPPHLLRLAPSTPCQVTRGVPATRPAPFHPQVSRRSRAAEVLSLVIIIKS